MTKHDPNIIGNSLRTDIQKLSKLSAALVYVHQAAHVSSLPDVVAVSKTCRKQVFLVCNDVSKNLN